MTQEADIRRNLAAIRDRIFAAAARAGRDASDVTLVAVTKSVGVVEIQMLRDLGIRHFGENRVDVARQKIEAIDDDSLTWHMVGNIQRRKARDVVRLFDMIDAVDRISLADALQRQCEAEDMHCRVLVEVNVSGEGQKHGFAPEDLTDALAYIRQLSRLNVEGLLTMAPLEASRESLLAHFRSLREMTVHHGLSETSMGMSNDFEEAIESGATQVRVGRALFL